MSGAIGDYIYLNFCNLYSKMPMMNLEMILQEMKAFHRTAKKPQCCIDGRKKYFSHLDFQKTLLNLQFRCGLVEVSANTL